jgi:uncharacterized protein with PQ loop repeat
MFSGNLDIIVFIIGMIASVVGSFVFIPGAIKVLITKDTKSYSITMFLLQMFTNVL